MFRGADRLGKTATTLHTCFLASKACGSWTGVMCSPGNLSQEGVLLVKARAPEKMLLISFSSWWGWGVNQISEWAGRSVLLHSLTLKH